MPFADANSQLEPLMFQMKQYKNLTKSTIEILPSSGQTNYGPNQKAIFTLPYASLISLEDLAFHFEFAPTNVPDSSAENFESARVMPPKDIASLISEIDIKINGQTIQHLTHYNDIVNILNMFSEPKTAKKLLQNSDLTKSGHKNLDNELVYLDKAEYVPVWRANTKSKKYIINQWYGLLGARGKEVSSNFVDTNMLGEVTIAFTFASAATCCFLPITSAGATAAAATAKPPVNVTTTAIVTEAATAFNAANVSYKLSDLKMSMVRYNLPMEYSEALRSNLSSGAKYQIAFNHYQIYTEAASKSSGSIRWNENSRDIKGLIAFFTSKTRDSGTRPLPYSALIETSPYFLYDNTFHVDSQYQIGSTKMPQNRLDSTDCFLEVVRAAVGARGNNTEFVKTLDSVEKFTGTYFMNYLSLEMSEGMTFEANDGKKLLSGLSSEQLPISMVYEYSNNATGVASFDKNVNVLSLTTRLLVIENGQNCYVMI